MVYSAYVRFEPYWLRSEFWAKKTLSIKTTHHWRISACVLCAFFIGLRTKPPKTCDLKKVLSALILLRTCVILAWYSDNLFLFSQSVPLSKRFFFTRMRFMKVRNVPRFWRSPVPCFLKVLSRGLDQVSKPHIQKYEL